MTMISSAALVALAGAPEAPAPSEPPTTDEEYRAAVERQRADEAKRERPERPPPPALNPLNHGGGFVIAGFGVEAYVDRSPFRYSFEGGGIMGPGVPSATVGARFTHVLDEPYVLSAPVRLGVAGEQVGVYGLFEPGVALLHDKMTDPESSEEDEISGRWRVAGGLSIFIMAWRGLTIGADATWANLNTIVPVDDDFGDDTAMDIRLPSFSFVAFIGWKFGA